METPVKYNGPARVTVYENGDVDVRLPRENEDLKLQKVKETQAGSLTRTQGNYEASKQQKVLNTF
ncbi:MAG: hypothetical protein K5778_03250 [Bacteroidaceae bacterium]|nr:hypothetical protein [Bacteroidaceae bacterium]